MDDPILSNRTALVTGVGRRLGLGFAVARQLAERGHHVVLAARNLAQADDLAATLRSERHDVEALRLDLADRASILDASDRLSDRVGRLDVLVNNASPMPDFETMSALGVDPVALRELLDVNVIGCWELIQAMLPLLRRAPRARIVNVSSAGADQIGRGLSVALRAPAYSFAKQGLNVLTGILAAALAETPILVNAVDPGAVATHPERGNDGSDRSPAEAAAAVVRAAMLDDGGPTGCLFRGDVLAGMLP